MKQILTILLSAVCLAGITAEFDLSISKNLKGWQRNTGKSSFDASVTLSDKGSLKLINSSSLYKTIELEANTEYEVSVYIKAENVTGGKYRGVLLRLTDGNKHFAITGDPKNLPRQGSFDWIKCTRTFNSSIFKNSKIKVMPALTCNGTVWFADLKIEKKKQVTQGDNVFRKQFSDAVNKAALIPEGVFGFFDSTQEISFKVLCESTSKNLEYALTVKDESGSVVYRIPRKKLDKTFKIPPQDNGYYVVDAEIFADGKKAYFIQSAFAVNTPVKKLDPFFQLSYGALPDMIPGLKRIGTGGIVIKYQLKTPVHKNSTPAEAAERFIKSNRVFLEDKDFKLMIMIACSPRREHRSDAEFNAGYPLFSDAVLNHLLETVTLIHKQTRNRVRTWGVGCEIPSNATGGSKKNLASTWTEAMFNVMVTSRMVSRRLKSSDPTLKMIVGGNNRQEFTETVERIVMTDLVDDVDGYAIDAYTGNWNMILGRHSIPEQNLMKFYTAASNLSYSLGKGKFIHNNETGYAINYGARFDRGLAVEQAELTARTIIISRYAPVSCFELHKPADKQWLDSTCQDDSLCMTTCWKPFRFGKKEFYHIPLPGGAMYATCASELSYAKALAEIKNGNIYSYLFKKPDGSILITLWNIANEQLFICNFPADAAVKNMYGRSIPLKNLVIGKAPVYITVKMQPEQAVAMMKKAVFDNTPEFKCTALENKIYIQSYASETRICRLQIPGQKEKTVKILPGKITTVDCAITANAVLIAPNGRKYDVPLKKFEEHTITRLKTTPVFDGSGAWLKNLTSGMLKYPDHIRPAEALQPERRYFRTSFNPDGHNISAQYWTAYDDKNFYLAVKVDDPVHQQRQQPLAIWRDDCLQFVLSHESGSGVLAESGKKPQSPYNFALALTPQGTRLVKLLGKDSGIKDYPAVVTRNGNTTFYEVAIPWQAINGKARRFGFVVFNNNWATRNSAPYHLDFSEGITNGADDTKLKVLRYAE